MKKLYVTFIAMVLTIFGFSRAGADSSIYMVLVQQSIGMDHQLTSIINDSDYHKIFSFGYGPFLPVAGFQWRMESEKLSGSIGFAMGTSPGETDFGAPINLSAVIISASGGYRIYERQKFSLLGKGELGTAILTLYTPYSSDSSVTPLIRAGIESRYLLYKSDEVKAFAAVEGGLQIPFEFSFIDEDFSLEPYYLKIMVGIGQ